MTRCQHLNIFHGEILPFMGGVAERTEDINEAAHGGVRFEQKCLVCGAVREVLYNNRHEEYSLWHLPRKEVA
jgi:hypothetical protein